MKVTYNAPLKGTDGKPMNAQTLIALGISKMAEEAGLDGIETDRFVELVPRAMLFIAGMLSVKT